MEHGNKKHGLSGTMFYRSWFSIKDRCRNKNAINYKNYGGRGINYEKSREQFNNFYADMHKTYFDGATIDRIDNNGNYCKENCRRATKKQQANNRRNNEKVTIDGITKNIIQRADFYGIDWRTLYTRIRGGMDKIDALTRPVKEKRSNIEFNGQNLSLRGWSEKLGIGYNTLWRRLYVKMYPIEVALSQKKYAGKTVI